MPLSYSHFSGLSVRSMAWGGFGKNGEKTGFMTVNIVKIRGC